MLKLAVLVSGGGTNLQAIMDGIASGSITNAKIVTVISNNKNAYALTRAEQAGIPASCISPKDYADREAFHEALLKALVESEADLIVLAGCLVVIPEMIIDPVPESDYQYPSVSDPVILWNGVLWTESPRRSTLTWCKTYRCNGTFCG